MTIRVGPTAIIRAARRHGPPGGIGLIVLRQWVSERRVRRQGRGFRHQANDAATSAYAQMTPGQFAAINARQAWANWRAIPRTLHRRAPKRPLMALDLACGDGASSAALAHHLPPGSTLVGLEYAPRLVARANRRTYLHADGSLARVRAVAASILDPFVDQHRRPLTDDSVDWINCAGALAHHFTRQQLDAIAAECARVLRPGGWAAVDANGTGDADPVIHAFHGAGLELDGQEKSCPFDRYRQLCFRSKEA